MPKLIEVLAKKMRDLRIERGLNQEEIAKLLGISRPTVSHYETGTASLSVHVVEKLAALYGVEETELFISTSDSLGSRIERLERLLAARLPTAPKAPAAGVQGDLAAQAHSMVDRMTEAELKSLIAMFPASATRSQKKSG